jgi:acyl carrier protein
VFAPTRPCKPEREGTLIATLSFGAAPGNGIMSEPGDSVRRLVFDTLRAATRNSVELSDRTNIVRELGLDSVAIMDFVMEMEDRLDISVPLDRIAEVETVGDLVATMRDLTGKD